jgi:hypothetical protein
MGRLAIIFGCQPFFMNKECTRLADQLASTINGEAWYGEPLREILAGITVKQALAHPISSGHSIWELVRHVEAWVNFAYGALQGVAIPQWPAMPKEQDWPPVTQTDEKAWREAVTSCLAANLRLAEAIKGFSDERLETAVPGRAYNFSRLFQGMTQHAIYHSGQIALLKKAAA